MSHVAISHFDAPPDQVSPGKIDLVVLKKLKQLGIEPAAPCSDEVFVRRVYLDVIGTLPTPEEARSFLQDTTSNKRSVLIDRLLQRDEFADYWAMKWSDLLRVKSEFPINLWPLAAQNYHKWLRTCVKENWTYDRMARELLTASGSNFRVPQVNFYRAVPSKLPVPIAKTVALSFMGVRAEKWPASKLSGLAVFFSKLGFKATGEWKEEILFYDPTKKPTPGLAAKAIFPDGKPAVLPADTDPRDVFAIWLITPQNFWFTRNIANRVWSWLIGRGIIQEPDDIRTDNPPSNPELLALLEKELIAAKYDLKHLFKIILNSKTYQASLIPKTNKKGMEAYFASYRIRRLEAEVLIDALDQITGTNESYTSAAPEPYTFIPEDQRSIALADGSITSPFLEMFGRPARDTGLESERNNKPTPAQRLHMLNSSHIRRKIEQGPILTTLLNRRGSTPRDIENDLYLTILSRYPTEDEHKVIDDYIAKSGNRRNALVDIAWATINSSEFQYRH